MVIKRIGKEFTVFEGKAPKYTTSNFEDAIKYVNKNGAFTEGSNKKNDDSDQQLHVFNETVGLSEAINNKIY